MANASAAPSFLVPATAAVSTPSACPSKKTTAAVRRRRTVPCRASGGRGDVDDSLLWLPRREVLTGLSGVAAGIVGFPDLASLAAVEGSPMESFRRGDKVTDNLLLCKDPAGKLPCPPPSTMEPVDFKKFKQDRKIGEVVRFRKPAHLLSAAERDRYREAVGRMKALPASNPLSFEAQAAIHQAYCDAHYRYDPTEKNRPFDVHFSWIFAPWHRMYIYFFERALGDLVGDDSLALPYWNWDAPGGMGMPAVFTDRIANPLYDANRNQDHMNALINLDLGSQLPTVPFNPTPGTADDHSKTVQSNLSTVYIQQIRDGKSPLAYFGDKLCTKASFKINELNERSKMRRNVADQAKVDRNVSQGTLERMAHTAVHVWTGRPGVKGNACQNPVTGHDLKPHCTNDMGFLGTAARDPLFYSHHANVDRMWHLWATRLGGRGFADPEWLDASFDFYVDPANPRLVRIKFSDVLDAANLGYTYVEPEEELPWMNSKPARFPASSGKGRRPPPPEEKKKAPAELFPLALTKGQAVEVPAVPLPAKQAGKERVLTIDGIEYDPMNANSFNVVFNLPKEDAVQVTPQHSEFAGKFSVMSRSVMGADGKLVKPTLPTMVGKLTLFIDGVLEDIGAGEDSTVDIVLVPKTDMTIYIPPTIENVSGS